MIPENETLPAIIRDRCGAKKYGYAQRVRRKTAYALRVFSSTSINR